MRSILITIALLSAASGVQAARYPTTFAAEDSANRGLYVALRICAACHAVGPLGHGPDGAAPSFATLQQRFDGPALRRRLADISTSGHELMPPIAMTPREIEDVATYIASVGPPPHRVHRPKA